MTHTEGNKIIAEFMGKETTCIEYEKNERVVCPIPLYYHSSWDWLMPCYIKFKDLKFEEAKDRHYHKQVLTALQNGILSGDIENACNDMIMAIKWYNNQKPVI